MSTQTELVKILLDHGATHIEFDSDGNVKSADFSQPQVQYVPYYVPYYRPYIAPQEPFWWDPTEQPFEITWSTGTGKLSIEAIG